MNWDNVRYFLAVARAGSVSAAARDMDVKHTTIMRRLEQLEADVGVKLFNRLTSGYRLTEAGTSILDEAEIMEASALAMNRQLRGADQELSGKISITFLSDFRAIVAPLLAEFCRQYPSIELMIDVDSNLKNLGQLESDIALRVIANPPESLVGRQLSVERFSPYIGLPQRHPTYSNPADYRWIVWSQEVDGLMENWITTHFGPDSIVARTNDVYTAQALVEAGVGATFLPDHMVKDSANFRLLDTITNQYEMPLWLLTHPEYRGVLRYKVLMDFLAERIPELL